MKKFNYITDENRYHVRNFNDYTWQTVQGLDVETLKSVSKKWKMTKQELLHYIIDSVDFHINSTKDIQCVTMSIMRDGCYVSTLLTEKQFNRLVKACNK